MNYPRSRSRDAEAVMREQDRPQLRPFLAAGREDRDGRHYVLYDQLRLSDCYLRLTALELEFVKLFDGERTLRDVQAEAMKQLGGHLVPLEVFTRLAKALDEALFLDGPRFRERAGGPVRAPACIGCYEGEPKALRRQLKRLFTGPGASGLPGAARPDDGLRAALVPHIDYARGGKTYSWAFKEVVERSPASLFVIVGTAHYSGHRFTLTRQHFQTPLGIVPTDQVYVDRLVKEYGDGLFDDALAHLPEHSIELEVVLLQYLLEGKRPFRIVPLLVGSFHDAIADDRSPAQTDDVRRMIEALRKVDAETKEPICYLISGDLAHVGPKFGDPEVVTEPFLAASRKQDEALLDRAGAADAEGYFRVIAGESDVRRICGLPPTYLVLEAIRPGGGKVLHYDQYVHPRGYESVSFASMAFYR
jgi:AmmeMemoRadiSam system protein B